MPPDQGCLFLVVGPSGVGKDSILDGARAYFAADPGIVFPRRVITRPAHLGGEAHDAVSNEEFMVLEKSGAFALSWRAHGYAYGIPQSIVDELRAGCPVVVNVSRTVIDEARKRFCPMSVIVITARPEIIAERLNRRGRESADEIRDRIQRSSMTMPAGADVRYIDNSGSMDKAVSAFCSVIRPINAFGKVSWIR